MFCIYYIVRGVLQENRQELVAFVLSVVVLMIRSVVNFAVLGPKAQQDLLVGRPLLASPRPHTIKFSHQSHEGDERTSRRDLMFRSG